MGIKSAAAARLWSVIKAVIVIELVYLVVVNALLSLPLTQNVVNSIKPDKFKVSWERAWSWYPVRVHATGVAANGQSRSQQWELHTPSLSASIALLPLAMKRVWVSDVTAMDIDYRQRPRLKEGKNYEKLLPYFAPISGREVSEAVTAPRADKGPWHIAVDDMRASGNHSYWIFQARGKASGEFLADLTFETRGGPFSLDAHSVDIALDTLYLNETEELFTAGALRGSLAFAPFIPKENKGAAMLEFLNVDADLEVDANSLAFISLFTGDLEGMSVDGSGKVSGRLRFNRGDVLSGTDVSVDADDLLVNVMGHAIGGEGTVKLELGPATDESLDLSFIYRDLQVVHGSDSKPLLIGKGLGVKIGGNARLLPTPGKVNETRSLGFFLDGLAVPDLALLQHYLPSKWPLKLHGGNGYLTGRASLSPSAMDVDLSLKSDDADMGAGEYRFVTNLDAALKLDNPSVSTQRTSMSGTYIKLGNAQLSADVDEAAVPWDASLQIDQGYFSLLGNAGKQQDDNVVDLVKELEGAASSELLSQSSASIEFSASVSSLQWIDVLLGKQHNTGINGRGTVTGVLELFNGLPAPGTQVEILSRELTVQFLDYRSSGDGEIKLQVEEGDTNPDWGIEVALVDADLKRLNEEVSQIDNVNLNLAALVQDVSFRREKGKDEEREASLSLKILSANVSDMSVFNSYLPPESPVQLAGGTAALSADIMLLSDDADGWVKLRSRGTQARAENQSIEADLDVDIVLVGGVPADMEFDVSGSTLQLSNVHVQGQKQDFEQQQWSANFKLLRGKTSWAVPLRLDIEAQLLMSDTRPLVAMFDNQGWKPEFLLEMMLVEDIQGVATIKLADQKMTFTDTLLTGDKIEIAAKGVITEQSRDGAIYARYKKKDALVKIRAGKKNLDFINVREKFDAYEVPP